MNIFIKGGDNGRKMLFSQSRINNIFQFETIFFYKTSYFESLRGSKYLVDSFDLNLITEFYHNILYVYFIFKVYKVVPISRTFEYTVDNSYCKMYFQLIFLIAFFLIENKIQKTQTQKNSIENSQDS